MPTAPLELRFYLRRVTLDEIAAGVQPVRQRINDSTALFHPPLLQYRWREKSDNGVTWSEWCEVGYAREDDPVK